MGAAALIGGAAATAFMGLSSALSKKASSRAEDEAFSNEIAAAREAREAEAMRVAEEKAAKEAYIKEQKMTALKEEALMKEKAAEKKARQRGTLLTENMTFGRIKDENSTNRNILGRYV